MSTIVYRVEDRVARITLDRAEKLNAINAEMRRELFQAFEDVKANPDVWLAVINAHGRAFCVGHDLSEFLASGDETAPSIEALYLSQLETYKPIIASIHGYCLAQGAGLALCSDIRIASDRAQFGWPQVKRGIASVSGPALLAHRIPLNFALEALLTGELIDAQTALRLNLVNRVVPHDELDAATEAAVAQVRANAPLAARAIKEATVRGLSMPTADRIRFAALMLERVNATQDAAEGLAAFAEKRQPQWRGR